MPLMKKNSDYIKKFFDIYDIKRMTPLEYLCWKYSETKKLYTTLESEKTDYINFINDKLDKESIKHHKT
ncbi:12568_t:CDS:1, partial [Dentiscutata erythropus]